MKICRFEIDAILLSFYFKYHKPCFVIKRPVYIYGTFYEILDLYNSVLFKPLFLSQGLCYRRPIYTTLCHTISLCISVFWCLAHARCQCYEVRYLVWFKTAASSGRSVQFASNLVCS